MFSLSQNCFQMVNARTQIGKTSAVVLTMAGVLKDILLVVASMAIFGDPVSGQQYFGYGIALVGLTYYKLGAEKMNAMFSDARLYVNETRQNKPATVKVIALCAALGVVTIVTFGWWRTTPGASIPVPSE